MATTSGAAISEVDLPALAKAVHPNDDERRQALADALGKENVDEWMSLDRPALLTHMKSLSTSCNVLSPQT